MSEFEKVAAEIGKLVTEKNEAYGDAFGKSGQVLSILYPEGIRPEQLTDALTVVRVLDKLFRVATRKEAFGESPWRDITGYGLLATVRDEADGEAELEPVVLPVKDHPHDTDAGGNCRDGECGFNSDAAYGDSIVDEPQPGDTVLGKVTPPAPGLAEEWAIGELLPNVAPTASRWVRLNNGSPRVIEAKTMKRYPVKP